MNQTDLRWTSVNQSDSKWTQVNQSGPKWTKVNQCKSGSNMLKIHKLLIISVVSLPVNYPLKVINRIGSSGCKGIGSRVTLQMFMECCWELQASKVQKLEACLPHDEVWNRWSSLDPTCPLISKLRLAHHINVFFHFSTLLFQSLQGAIW